MWYENASYKTCKINNLQYYLIVDSIARRITRGRRGASFESGLPRGSLVRSRGA
jgi:hypothetical protein